MGVSKAPLVLDYFYKIILETFLDKLNPLKKIPEPREFPMTLISDPIITSDI